jgi:hypothetical protein
VGAAYAGFEHATAPDGDVAGLAEIVNAASFVVTAYAAEFDVDNFASAESDGGFRLFVSVNAFIEADGSLERFLDFDVAEEVVPAEGLLDHHEVERVELFEQGKIFPAISGVGVDGKFDARKFLANTLDYGEILAGLDFEFDALVAGREFVLHAGDEFFDGVFYADRDTGGDFSLRAAKKFPERKIFLSGFGVPDGGFDGGFGHGVTANVFEKSPDVGGAGEWFVFQQRPEKFYDDVPTGFGVFGTVERAFACGAFSPAYDAIDVGLDEDDVTIGDPIHAGFEWVDELEMNFTESELTKLHGNAIPPWGRRA